MKKLRISSVVAELSFAVYRIIPRFANTKEQVNFLYNSLIGTDRPLNEIENIYVQKVKTNIETIKEDIERMEKMLILLQDSTEAKDVVKSPKQLYCCKVCSYVASKDKCLVGIQGLACPSCGYAGLEKYILKE